MGLFGTFFGKDNDGNTQEENSIAWIALTSLNQLDEIYEKSKSKPQVIFKHSTTCGISRMVFNTFKKTYNFSSEQIDLYYLDLLAYRDVSNETALRFQVIHQSPQLLIIKNGVCVENASHGAISEVDLSKYVAVSS